MASLDCTARVAGASGKRVLLMEQTAHWGGRAQIDEEMVDGVPVDKFVDDTVAHLQSLPNVPCAPV